jgi:hypothetical protein
MALPDADAGMTNEPFPVNSWYLRMPPPAEIVVHAGMPAVTPKT